MRPAPDDSATFAAAEGDPHKMLLMRAAMVIAEFRSKLRSAGYPFREPVNTVAIVEDIDRTVYPIPVVKLGRKPRSKNKAQQQSA